jgi:hypothetical protein
MTTRVIEKRYSDFQKLHTLASRLAAVHGVTLPHFPSGGALHYFNRNSTAVAVSRQAAFQQLMDTVTAHESMATYPTIVTFCCRN